MQIVSYKNWTKRGTEIQIIEVCPFCVTRHGVFILFILKTRWNDLLKYVGQIYSVHIIYQKEKADTFNIADSSLQFINREGNRLFTSMLHYSLSLKCLFPTILIPQQQSALKRLFWDCLSKHYMCSKHCDMTPKDMQQNRNGSCMKIIPIVFVRKCFFVCLWLALTSLCLRWSFNPLNVMSFQPHKDTWLQHSFCFLDGGTFPND